MFWFKKKEDCYFWQLLPSAQIISPRQKGNAEDCLVSPNPEAHPFDDCIIESERLPFLTIGVTLPCLFCTPSEIPIVEYILWPLSHGEHQIPQSSCEQDSCCQQGALISLPGLREGLLPAYHVASTKSGTNQPRQGLHIKQGGEGSKQSVCFSSSAGFKWGHL